MPPSPQITAGLEAEMQAILKERPEINICFASDGAAPQWTALEAMRSRLPASATGHTMMLIDAFHVAEYVQLAANAVEGENTSGARSSRRRGARSSARRKAALLASFER